MGNEVEAVGVCEALRELAAALFEREAGVVAVAYQKFRAVNSAFIVAMQQRAEAEKFSRS